MKRYEQGSVGMRPDPEGLWCDYAEAKAEIERLRQETLVQSEAIKRLRELLQGAVRIDEGDFSV